MEGDKKIETKEDVTELLWEVIVGMRNSPTRRAIEFLAANGYDVLAANDQAWWFRSRDAYLEALAEVADVAVRNLARAAVMRKPLL